jgi:hypothetical protein
MLSRLRLFGLTPLASPAAAGLESQGVFGPQKISFITLGNECYLFDLITFICIPTRSVGTRNKKSRRKFLPGGFL